VEAWSSIALTAHNNAYVGTALAMSIAFAEAVPVIYKCMSQGMLPGGIH
jgi:hypothetical protein